MIEEKLQQLGITLPNPPTPAGSYIPVVISGKLAFVSGQIPVKDGSLEYTGKINEDNIDAGKASAKLCAINIIAQLKRELGDLERIEKIVRLNGFVNCEPEFCSQPKVINGASDFLYEIFGEKGKHSRIAVGVSSLPLNSSTEIDAVVQIS